MRRLIQLHSKFWTDRKYFVSAITGILFLLISFVVNYLAGMYATSMESNSVNDLILDNIPVFDVRLIFFQGFFLFSLTIVSVLLLKPSVIPFATKSISFFILIRSIFISLTHIRHFPEIYYSSTSSVFRDIFTFGGDLFFSAHTGMPFLLALIFWKNKILRNIFLGFSVLFGVSVLLGHLHYSIDVFAAFFITHSLYRISRYLFVEDYKLVTQD